MVSIFYLIAQMVGAGALVALLLGIKAGTTFLGMDADTAKIATIILVGALMIIYVMVGGMKGTTYVQIVKAFMLMIGALVMTLLVLGALQVQPVVAARRRRRAVRQGRTRSCEPGLRYGVEIAGDATQTFYSKMDLLSLGIALVLGTAGLPHILIRFYTVPTAKVARKSVLWAIGIIGTFYLFTLALGFGAAALVGRQGDHRAGQGRQHRRTAARRRRSGIEYLGGDIGGAMLLAIIAAVAFATILAVVAGLTLASSSSLAHDFYANVIKRGQAVRAGGGPGRPDLRARSSARSRSRCRSSRRA